VWLQGPELFVGYADAGRNAGTITSDGWFRTGDVGVLDDDGWLRIVGRIKDVIIRGGENISAVDVEHLLESHPSIRQAAAVGYPDERLGERVCAFVVSDDLFGLHECRRWFESNGATKFTWPERIEVLDELPTLPSGKVDRARLRALAAR
jgi:non-ribosomal peptide synthetase component E (peptide arylation enzyme)